MTDIATDRLDPVFEALANEHRREMIHALAIQPRSISQLADLALLAGAGQSLDRIDVATVEGVYYELGVVPT